MFTGSKVFDRRFLKKFKRKIISDYHWNNYKKMKNDYKFLNKFIKKKNKELVKNLKNFTLINLSEKFLKLYYFPG